MLDGISEFMRWYWFSKSVIGVFYPSLVLSLAKLRVCLLRRLVPFCFFLFFAPFGLLITANVSRSHSTFIPFGTRLRNKVPAARFVMLFSSGDQADTV